MLPNVLPGVPHVPSDPCFGPHARLDLATGKIEAEIAKLGKGSMVYGDGLIYGYTEDGKVSLVDPEAFQVISSFEIDEGSGQHWSHPVISDGVLYVRHGEALMAFDVKDR